MFSLKSLLKKYEQPDRPLVAGDLVVHKRYAAWGTGTLVRRESYSDGAFVPETTQWFVTWNGGQFPGGTHVEDDEVRRVTEEERAIRCLVV